VSVTARGKALRVRRALRPVTADGTTRVRPSVLLVAGAVVGVVLLALLRGHWLLSNGLLNPDEAVLLADGKRAALNLAPYHTYTTSTDLTLWPIFLGVLADLGVPMTLPTAHLLSGFFYLVMTLAGWFVIARRLGWTWATAIVVPTAAYLFAKGTSAASGDFFSLGTELLPITAVFVAALVLYAPSAPVSRRRLAIAAAIAGTAIWAKPQVGPLAAAFIASAVIIRNAPGSAVEAAEEPRSRALRDAAAAAGGFLLPSALLLIVILASGTFHAFSLEGLDVVFSYVHHANAATVTTFGGRVSAVGTFLVGYPFAFLWAIGGLFGWPLAAGRRELTALAVAWALPLVACILTLFVLSPQLFPHYANFAYAAGLLSAVVGCQAHPPLRTAEVTRVDRFRLAAVATATSALCLVTIGSVLGANVPFALREAGTAISGGGIRPVDPYDDGASTLPKLCPAGSQVFVWGFSAELYSYFNWTPASRYTANWQISNALSVGDHIEYYRQVLEEELRGNPPRCLVEAIGPSFFEDVPARDTIAGVMPGLAPFLRRCYVTRATTVGVELDSVVPESGQALTVLVRRPACT